MIQSCYSKVPPHRVNGWGLTPEVIPMLPDSNRKRSNNRAYYAAHREELIAAERIRYFANRDEKLAYQVAYRDANRDRLRARDRAYYAAHREERLARNNVYGKMLTSRFKEWLHIYKDLNPCADCGNPSRDLHHVDPADKTVDISKMCGSSLDALETEMEKCVALCRPCHKLRHYAMVKEAS